MGVLSDLARYAWRRADNFLSGGIHPDPLKLCSISGKSDVDKWRVFTDAAFGGGSNARLELGPDSKTAVFTGVYSKALGDAGQLVRSGYCGANLVRRRNVNLSMHDYITFRVRGDGHTYIASVRTDQLTGGDEEAWQAPLPTRSDGQWEDVKIDFNDFIFTFRGRLVRHAGAVGSMPRDRVMAVGVTLSASEDMPPQGTFRLELESITAGAYEAQGSEAMRKAFKGDREVRPDPMCDRQYNRITGTTVTPGETLGGRRHHRSGSGSTAGGTAAIGSTSSSSDNVVRSDIGPEDASQKRGYSTSPRCSGKRGVNSAALMRLYRSSHLLGSPHFVIPTL